MLSSQRGSIYRAVLACLIVLAFCFALTWPKYTKYHNARQLSEAAHISRALAFAQESFKQAHGQYTANFSQLDLSLPCPLVNRAQGVQMDCAQYVYQLQEGHIIKAQHKHLPVWLEVDIPGGSVACKYEADDWAGEDLCSRMQ